MGSEEAQRLLYRRIEGVQEQKRARKRKQEPKGVEIENTISLYLEDHKIERPPRCPNLILHFYLHTGKYSN
jgi:hypothetical protein